MDELKTLSVHRVMTDDDRKVLVEGDELPECDDNSTSLLVKPLAVPVTVQLVQLLFDTIMLTNPDRVLRCQTTPIVHPTIASTQKTCW